MAFEIKVALLGHVSVGKTTVLNALFKDKYSEVSMRRTTAGINYFRLKNSKPVRSLFPSKGSEPADAVLHEITALNARLRKEPKINESYFDIQLEEPLFTTRPDTELVIVDVPGLNEAGTSRMYHDYVEEKWETFDCVIVVMDARQGVNTDEQVALLQFVKNNMEKRIVPMIILCNKVDEPDDVEVRILVEEVRQEVARIFGSGREFIPISACVAFLYRAASRLRLEEFKRLDKEYIDKIGKEECGRYKWRKMNTEERYRVVHEVVNDQAQYGERLRACNFDAFLQALQNILGINSQTKMIAEQIELKASKLSSEVDFVRSLDQLFEKSRSVGIPVRNYGSRFWSLWKEKKSVAIVNFKKNPQEFVAFHHLFDQLSAYATGLHEKLFCNGQPPANAFLTKEKTKDFAIVLAEMKGLVQEKCAIIVEQCAAWNWHEPPHKVTTPNTWTALNAADWSVITDCICIQSHSKVFCENFAPQFADLQYSIRRLFGIFAKYMTVKYGGREACRKSPHFLVPKKFSDDQHWGHLEWKVCKFLERFEGEAEDNLFCAGSSALGGA